VVYWGWLKLESLEKNKDGHGKIITVAFCVCDETDEILEKVEGLKGQLVEAVKERVGQ
jgi:hypothetical protein